jgi:hypothetical protein
MKKEKIDGTIGQNATLIAVNVPDKGTGGPAPFPTSPYVKISLIRFFDAGSCYRAVNPSGDTPMGV